MKTPDEVCCNECVDGDGDYDRKQLSVKTTIMLVVEGDEPVWAAIPTSATSLPTRACWTSVVDAIPPPALWMKRHRISRDRNNQVTKVVNELRYEDPEAHSKQVESTYISVH
jgi:hypothetical protein